MGLDTARSGIIEPENTDWSHRTGEHWTDTDGTGQDFTVKLWT